MKIVLLGPNGAGKGLQAKIMVEYLHIPHISTGDMFRQMAEEKSPLGIEAKEKYWIKGNLVPDDITTRLLKERIEKHDCSKGFILDGFPRTIPQAESLEKITKLNHVILFQIQEDEILDRLAHRKNCNKCKRVYGRDIQPKKDNLCDDCQVPLVRRKDDEPELVKERLKIYSAQTAPLIQFYNERGLLIRIDADQPYAVVSDDIKVALGHWI